MTREIISNDRTGEKYTRIKHDSGLEILIWKTEGYSIKHALFGTRYGSVNTTFKTRDDADFVTVPNGIAHYLEHKLFENEDCGVFELYAKTGAFGNAYTSFDRTCYLFSCTENFIPSLKILLDFVQKPYFTEETVRKEQGIIGQEIRMYEDDPNWRVFFNMLGGIYHENPVKIDIAGTKEGIAQINADLLYRCYYTFYNLHNMVLAIAGDVDEDEIMKLCDEMLIPSENKELMTIVPEEPVTVASKYVEQKLEVAVPMFNIGYKSEPVSNEDIVRCEVLSDMVLAMLADETSDFYKRLYDEGLINSSFGGGFDQLPGVAVLCAGGESGQPQQVSDAILEEAQRLAREGIDPDFFEQIRRASFGATLRALNSFENIAISMADGYFRGFDALRFPEAYASIEKADVERFLRENLTDSRRAISIIEPKKEG